MDIKLKPLSPEDRDRFIRDNQDAFNYGALAGFLKNINADVLICGGIGGGAQMAMQEAGITLYGGDAGSADDAVLAFISDSLVQNDNPTCDHHGHEHGEGHTCGDHGCGKH